jgi:hypothetical protein
MHSLRSISLGAAACVAAMACLARPPISGHPIVGTWQLSTPGSTCQETWQFRADGTTHNVSGAEESTSEYEISDEPVSGYYVLTDTIRNTNGQPDCQGATMPVGDKVTVYLLPTTNGGFFLCMYSNRNSCVALMARAAQSDS